VVRTEDEVVEMPACVVCDEVITQPLCALCLEEEIATWLLEKFPQKPELLLRLDELTDDICSAGGATTCIKCHAPMSLCGFCYTEHIMAWVQAQFPQLIEEFLTLFSTYRQGVEIPEPPPKRMVPA
jgi:hypothetical protein